MSWNLFLDDERNLADVAWAPWQIQEKYRNEEWVVCRNVQAALSEIDSHGMPSFISFDHDLGQNELTGYDLTKVLVDNALDFVDECYQFPQNFDFYVHSKNPIGKANIESLLSSYLRHKSQRNQ